MGSALIHTFVVVDFELPFSAEETEKLIIALFASDGGEDLKRTFEKSGEVSPIYQLIFLRLRLVNSPGTR